MCTYAHSYYISCSYAGLSSEVKMSTVVDESLSVFKPMSCFGENFNYNSNFFFVAEFEEKNSRKNCQHTALSQNRAFKNNDTLNNLKYFLQALQQWLKKKMVDHGPLEL